MRTSSSSCNPPSGADPGGGAVLPWVAAALGALIAVGVGLIDAWLRGDPVSLAGWGRAHLSNPALWVVDTLPLLLALVVQRATPPTQAPPRSSARERQLTIKVEALTRARNEARAASRAKSRFLASMSHELRTPLNAIIGYSEMMREELVDGVPPDPADLQRVVTAARHLLQLINNVLDLSRIEVGRMSVLLEPLEVPAVIREVESTTAPLAEQNQNRFEVRISPELAHVRADPMRLRQILVNLLGNAFKFTEGGVVSLQARLEDHEGLRWAVFEVRDTGIGMTPEQMAGLFREYQQADGTIAQRFGGTGLGLALSQRLATLMSGRIEAESAPGSGSTFRLFLPVPDTAPPPAQPAEGRRVLILDDDPVAGHLVRRLGHAGWDVVRATTVERAKRELDPAGVVLVDVHTDDGAGWDLLQELGGAGARVVATSVDDDDHERAIALGAAAFLRKPHDPGLVEAALKRVRVSPAQAAPS